MHLLKSIIDIVIIILLIRLLVNPREAFYDQIYSLIYKITDPILKPSAYITRNHAQMVLLTITGLVVLRGIVYVIINSISLIFRSAIRSFAYWTCCLRIMPTS